MKKTTFTTIYGQFEYIVLAIGLYNTPATFQTLINSIFRDAISNSMVFYLDDLLIFSSSEEDCLSHLILVLRRLREQNLLVSPKKRSLMKAGAKFLGHLAGKHGIRADPAKVDVVRKWLKPENLPDLREFLGLIQFFKRFLKNFFDKARPFAEITGKDK